MLRDPNRIEPFLKEFGKIWKEYPDLRFTQLIVNTMRCCGSDLFYVEEESFLDKLKECYKVKE